MAGIYIHIPFCKQACHYCDFHFSTSLKKKEQLVDALCQELIMRKEELPGPIETIYVGGGTPSLLSEEELDQLFEVINEHYKVSKEAEITLEANPDDLSEEKINMLSRSRINRLSIGVQSFFEEDLTLMNRAHNAKEALMSIEMASAFFDNISIDLIYGIPGMSNERWKKNLTIAISLGVPHISSYALTVEPRTALKALIEKGKIQPVEEEVSRLHYDILVYEMKKAGFVNYEFSNFGKRGYFSKNNTAYWMGKPYLGIGPSAHSFDGAHRCWNVSNNTVYVKSILQGVLPQELESLSVTNRYNEYIMTRLRTMWGVSLVEIMELFGKKYCDYFEKEAQNFFAKGVLEVKEDRIVIALKGKFLSDGIASGLFYID